mmetsp:Transcript_21461/g.61262  ORF Transcript_21461/g.61262 Transcript_21461/m.61262 type:complete len:269 (-) Transcript_21461:174-980(-)
MIHAGSPIKLARHHGEPSLRVVAHRVEVDVGQRVATGSARGPPPPVDQRRAAEAPHPVQLLPARQRRVDGQEAGVSVRNHHRCDVLARELLEEVVRPHLHAEAAGRAPGQHQIRKRQRLRQGPLQRGVRVVETADLNLVRPRVAPILRRVAGVHIAGAIHDEDDGVCSVDVFGVAGVEEAAPRRHRRLVQAGHVDGVAEGIEAEAAALEIKQQLVGLAPAHLVEVRGVGVEAGGATTLAGVDAVDLPGGHAAKRATHVGGIVHVAFLR